MFPAPLMPANKMCIVDLLDMNEDSMVTRNKKCILDYHNIDDPFDADGNGIFKYAQTQETHEALIVVDDYCIVAGTDTNYPWTNQWQLEGEDVPDIQEVTDTRFMVVCFVEPVFSEQLLESMMMGTAKEMNDTVGENALTEDGGEDIPAEEEEDLEPEEVVASKLGGHLRHCLLDRWR